MYTLKRLRKQLVALSLVVGLLSYSGVALAAGQPSASSGTGSPAATSISEAVPQSYNADSSVQLGMLVELQAKDPTTVVAMPAADIKNMLGVVIPVSNADITLTPQTVTTQQVLVATSGHYDVLVSNQNGPIAVGDYITVSAVAGVGMKADDNQTEILGKAAGTFSGTANVISSLKLKNSLGSSTTVAIGRIPVDLDIASNPLYQKKTDDVPGFLANIATTVAHKPVSAARIYLSAAILLIVCFITGNMLYAGVRSGMVAVGRNPLSRKSIIRSLIQTVTAGLIIFVAGVFAVYLLLKL